MNFNIFFSLFEKFDYFGLFFAHNLALKSKDLFSFIFGIISTLGNKGLIFIIIAIILMLKSKNRKLGFMIILALFFSFIYAECFLKNFVARVRPYNTNLKDFIDWGNYVKVKFKTSYSFPSGHVTATTACLLCFCYKFKNIKIYIISVLIVIMMSLSRIYFLAHFPSDCIFGIIVGILSGISSICLTKILWKIMIKNKNNKIFHFILRKNIC